MGTWSFRAIEREPFPIMRARAAAGGGGGGRPVPGSGSGSGSGSGPGPGPGLGSLPGLVLFRTDPPTGVRPVGRPMVTSLLVCQWLRACWTANSYEPVGRPKVAAFRLGSNMLAPPGVLYKALQSLN